MKLTYDHKYDILYISITDQENSYGHEEPEGFVIHRDMTTDEITGFTLFEASKTVKHMWAAMALRYKGEDENK